MTHPGRISSDDLLAFCSAVYEVVGMPPDDARLCADTLVQADLWGHQSHGVMGCPGTPRGCAPEFAGLSQRRNSSSMPAASR